MRGKIIDCINYGTLIQVMIKTEDGLENIPIDHRCFWHIVEAKGDIRGKNIEYAEDGKTVLFTEDRLE